MGRTGPEWSTSAPPPEYDYAVLPSVDGRDPFFDGKRKDDPYKAPDSDVRRWRWRADAERLPVVVLRAGAAPWPARADRPLLFSTLIIALIVSGTILLMLDPSNRMT